MMLLVSAPVMPLLVSSQAHANSIIPSACNGDDEEVEDDGGSGFLGLVVGALVLAGAGVALAGSSIYLGIEYNGEASAGRLPEDEQWVVTTLAVSNAVLGLAATSFSVWFYTEDQPDIGMGVVSLGVMYMGLSAWGFYEMIQFPEDSPIQEVTIAPMVVPEPDGLTVGVSLRMLSF